MVDSNIKACNGCTLCCRGTLTVQVKEHKVYPEHPCPLLTDSGCGIYDDLSRPAICDSYGCLWLRDWTMPEWMRPDKVGFLMTRKKDHVVLTGDFSGNKIDGAALLFAVQWCKVNNLTLFYTIKSPGQNAYVRGNIMNHPDSFYKTGSMDVIFEPVELFNNEQEVSLG